MMIKIKVRETLVKVPNKRRRSSKVMKSAKKSVRSARKTRMLRKLVNYSTKL
jgi:hypothetical protein